jgi:hypothetical protein
MALSQMLSSLYDSLFAPPGALDGEAGTPDFSSPSMEPTALSETHFATDADVSWHNGFGTMNDFEVPASGLTSFDNFDSSGQSDMFGSSYD